VKANKKINKEGNYFFGFWKKGRKMKMKFGKGKLDNLNLDQIMEGIK
jgi:hypothetical protein